MIRIGLFSRLGQVSIKTLRHYDDIGLLRPVLTDEWSGYRYYALDQLPCLNRILALKDLGLTLGEIARSLERGLSAGDLRAMLARQQQRVDEETARLERVRARLRQIESEGNMTDYDVVLKKVEPQIVASVRATISDWEQVGPTFNHLFDEAFGYVAQNGGKVAGPPFDVWHDCEMPDMQVEAFVPLQSPIPGSDRVQVSEMPGIPTAACAVHHGPLSGISAAVQAVVAWTEANGCKITGPFREVYLEHQRDGDPNASVTEIQYPIEKA